MAHHLRTEPVLSTLDMAIGQRRPREVIHPLRQGRPVPVFGHRQALPREGAPTPTGSTGGCFDNAMAESRFATLECKLIQRRVLETQAETRMAVFQFIEG